MPADIDGGGIAAKLACVAPQLVDHRTVLTHDLVHLVRWCQRKVRHHGHDAVGNHALADEAVVTLVQGLPIAAVEEDVDRGGRGSAGKMSSRSVACGPYATSD